MVGSERKRVFHLFLLGAMWLAAVTLVLYDHLRLRSAEQFVHYEAPGRLRELCDRAAMYYVVPRLGPDGQVLRGCAVPSASTPDVAGPVAITLSAPLPPSFVALGFEHEFWGNRYDIVSVGGCGHGPNEEVYTFRATGNLGAQHRAFSMSAWATESGHLVCSHLQWEE